MQAIAINPFKKIAATFCLCLAFSFAAGAQTNVLVWHKDGTMNADMRHEPLLPLLKSIAHQTGWRVYVEKGSTLDASTKFKNLPTGDALRMLLGDLNFALIPKANAPSQLYVFRTAMKNATHLVADKTAKHVPNQLTIKVKPGINVDALAQSLGGKVVGRMDKYGVYLLQFGDSDATDAALAQLEMDSNVQAVDYNYEYDPPPTPEAASAGASLQIPLTLNPPPSSGKVIVGLIDTYIDPQSLGADADQFILPQVDVADGTPSDSGPTHADAMASLILQAIANTTQSTSTSAQILPVNVYGSSETTTSYDVALGVQAAVNAGATVLNMSLGSSGDSSVLDAVLAQAGSDGITSFGAAGNTPTDSPYYPAADSSVIAVTALAQPSQPGQAGQLASYANSWPDPTMLALPGTGMFNYDNQTWSVQGTSTATAISSGIYVGNLAAGMSQQQILSRMETKFPVP